MDEILQTHHLHIRVKATTTQQKVPVGVRLNARNRPQFSCIDSGKYFVQHELLKVKFDCRLVDLDTEGKRIARRLGLFYPLLASSPLPLSPQSGIGPQIQWRVMHGKGVFVDMAI